MQCIYIHIKLTLVQGHGISRFANAGLTADAVVMLIEPDQIKSRNKKNKMMGKARDSNAVS